MDIKQLTHFLAASESGSFTRGAALANISQPALSASIAKLEAELGCQLFVRNKRNVALTPEGRRLKHSAEKIVGELDELKRSFRKRKQTTILRILAANSFPTPFLSDILKGFAITTPHVFFDVSDTGPVHRSDALDDRIYDLVFAVHAGEAKEMGKRELDWWAPEGGKEDRMIVLKEDLFGVAVPEDHPFASRQSLSMHDLKGEPFIARMHCEMRPRMEAWLQEKDMELQVRYRTEQDGRALTMVAAGLGLTIASMSENATQGVKFLPFRGEKWKRCLCLHVPAQPRVDVAKEVEALVRSLVA
ncbi:MAG: LysR family transcriptional regulator [Cohaesibacter sp.]|jgi:DNA-binding transcriptional LysR family regulator|nr:LysR family transcriptional regulator [Cohaesibacter sp.]